MRSERNAVVASFAATAVVSLWVAISWDPEPTLLVPVAFAGIGLMTEAVPQRDVRTAFLWSATVFLGAWALAASFTVGMFYIPSVLALGFASSRASHP
jgi:Na+-transporting methylmalonyl-CoA/oxaloacetate decarboxylase beta subunit